MLSCHCIVTITGNLFITYGLIFQVSVTFHLLMCMPYMAIISYLCDWMNMSSVVVVIVCVCETIRTPVFML